MSKFYTNNMVHRIQLERYSGKKSRFSCPKCGGANQFARYIDVETGEYVGEMFGRCNKIEKCGYHNPPTAKDLKDLSVFVPSNKVKEEYREPTFYNTMDAGTVLRTAINPEDNLSTFLRTRWDNTLVSKVLNRYYVGEIYYWGQPATIFWQIDSGFNIRTGKIMLYDVETGKRVKAPFNHIDWMHTPSTKGAIESYTDYNLKQCFFGEHLVWEPELTINVVESEKTALICTLKKPQTLWVATGGLQNINEDRMVPFTDKKLIFHPDKGQANKLWKDKLEQFKGLIDYEVSDFLETTNLPDGSDLADYILLK